MGAKFSTHYTNQFANRTKCSHFSLRRLLSFALGQGRLWKAQAKALTTILGSALFPTGVTQVHLGMVIPKSHLSP